LRLGTGSGAHRRKVVGGRKDGLAGRGTGACLAKRRVELIVEAVSVKRATLSIEASNITSDDATTRKRQPRGRGRGRGRESRQSGARRARQNVGRREGEGRRWWAVAEVSPRVEGPRGWSGARPRPETSDAHVYRVAWRPRGSSPPPTPALRSTAGLTSSSRRPLGPKAAVG
jgi:hypothetical protein